MPTVVAVLTLVFAALATPQGNDWLLVPGKRIGPIEAGTNHSDLIRLFGKSNVEDKPVDTGNGPEPATVVFARDRSAALTIIFQADRITTVFVCYPGSGPCKWHTANGVGLGTGIDALEKLNGGPFAAEPWGSDVGGNITSWQRGKLSEQFGDGGAFRLLLRLNYHEADNGPTPKQRKALEEIDRQKKVISNNWAVNSLRPTVSTMVFFFPAKE